VQLFATSPNSDGKNNNVETPSPMTLQTDCTPMLRAKLHRANAERDFARAEEMQLALKEMQHLPIATKPTLKEMLLLLLLKGIKLVPNATLLFVKRILLAREAI